MLIRLTQLNVLLVFFLTPVWLRLPNAPQPFTEDYFTGYLIFIPVVTALLLWAATRFYGLRALPRTQQLWLLLLFALAIWGIISTRWAFTRDFRPTVATGAALQFALAVIFVTMTLCVRLPLRWLTVTLALGILVHGGIGALQVARQGSIGLDVFGEFTLDPQVSGISVIQAGETRWLRPYGLASHPNVYAGFIATGLLYAAGLLFSRQRGMVALGIITTLFGIWMLMLTFSRGAWLGLIVAGVFALGVLFYHQRLTATLKTRPVMVTLICALLAVGLFFALYRPLLLVRVGVGTESTEVQSIGERAILTEIALRAARERPLIGFGAGNFGWYASDYLFYQTDLDLRGDHVHNIYLLVQAELGIVGSVLFGGALLNGLLIALSRLDESQTFHMRLFIVCGTLSFMVIGFFDHYPYTIFHYQLLWWGSLGIAGSPEEIPCN